MDNKLNQDYLVLELFQQDQFILALQSISKNNLEKMSLFNHGKTQFQ